MLAICIREQSAFKLTVQFQSKNTNPSSSPVQTSWDNWINLMSEEKPHRGFATAMSILARYCYPDSKY
ncbi:hypothetical protein Y1Q_0022487 [Alligator mississippiensis]|uniref:Uncharacterized protein n=1 Tax=Alligator mississippiensis TaxID=8496 RepID=A0A151N0D9_ALLMI|nr:hypothetical protein Y1Q_0022487 [Alligator mississippiensis]